MIDGAGIRAAREAAGMTQAELAAEVGVAQQTIEKIELGKVQRTTYLPEIKRALACVTDAVPLQVLRTILCASPTAEQILAALAANGLVVVAEARARAEQPIDGRQIIEAVCSRRGITTSRLCREVNIDPSTLNRFMSGNTASLTLTTLNKIIEWDVSLVHEAGTN